jgi:four helix bundle protein
MVHHVAIEVAADVVGLARTFRGPGAFSRGEQMMRAALSVSANIAEACGRGTQREFRHFIAIARGSAQELLSQLRVSGLVEPSPSGLRILRSVQSRTVLVIKMLSRLDASPPPPREYDA